MNKNIKNVRDIAKKVLVLFSCNVCKLCKHCASDRINFPEQECHDVIDNFNIKTKKMMGENARFSKKFQYFKILKTDENDFRRVKGNCPPFDYHRKTKAVKFILLDLLAIDLPICNIRKKHRRDEANHLASGSVCNERHWLPM